MPEEEIGDMSVHSVGFSGKSFLFTVGNTANIVQK